MVRQNLLRTDVYATKNQRFMEGNISVYTQDIKWKANQCKYELKINSNPDVYFSSNGRDIREKNVDIWSRMQRLQRQ